jgi:O-antigen/teichoic acid export membrane protein
VAETLHSETHGAGFGATVRKLLRSGGGEFVLFAASTLLFQGSRLIVSLVAAAWVGPERFGIWNILNLLLLYGAIVTLGVPNGMNREVPVQRGRGDEDAAQRIADQSFWFTLVSSLIGGVAIVGAALGGFAPQGDSTALAWAAALFVLWQIYQYLQMRLKSRGHFGQMSVQQLIVAVLFPVLVLPATYWWGIGGFVAGQVFVVLAVCAYLIGRDRPAWPGWQWPLLSNLIRIGGPIMLAGLLYSLLTTVDRWVIVNRLGVEALGHYSLAILCVGALSLFPAVIAQQIYPRMAFRFGATNERNALVPLVQKQIMLTVAITAPFLLGAALVLPWVVARWMPEYLPGVQPAQILLFGLIAVAFAGGPSNFLNTVGLQRLYLAVQAVTVIVGVLLSIGLILLGLGLNGVALGMSGAYVFYASLLLTVFMITSRRSTP